MIKVSALKGYGIELVAGDKTSYGPRLMQCGVKQIIDGDYEYDFDITEFAWRECDGNQPVNDNVIVDLRIKGTPHIVSSSTGHSCNWKELTMTEWRPNMQWLIEQEACNLDKDIASIKEGERVFKEDDPFSEYEATYKRDNLIQKAADTLTHTQYMHFMEIVDVLIEKEII